MRRVLALLIGLAPVGACSFGGGSFACERDEQCTSGGTIGRCETAVGFCSFMDSACASGWRYGAASGGQANVCVGDEVPSDTRPPDDGTPGFDTPLVDARLCYGGGLEICLASPLMGTRTLPVSLDTATMCDLVVTQVGGPELCVVTGSSITVTGTHASGARPLVLVADTISITGVLDVSSTRAGSVGAGANAAACATVGNGENDDGGGGGGGGGGFGGSGGDAGRADTNTSNAPDDGDANGGAGGLIRVSTFVRGGCKGGTGGNGDSPSTGGGGGNGGGAVYVIAGSSITIAASGAIFASGAGGSGAARKSSGGGGGGSGGLVGLDAPSIVIDGKVAANGAGGGGGGGVDNNAGDGAPGGDGTTTDFATRAPGGAGGDQVNNNMPAAKSPGGNGSALANIGGDPSGPCVGGSGGGGGGIGVIWVHGTVTGGTQVSPATTAH